MKNNWIIIGLSIVIGVLLVTNIYTCSKRGGGNLPPSSTVSDTTIVIDTITSNDTVYVYKTLWKEKIVEVNIPQDTVVHSITGITNYGDSIAVMDTIDIQNNAIIRHGQRVALNEAIYKDTTIIEKVITIRDTTYIRQLVHSGKTPTRFLYSGNFERDFENTDFSVGLELQTNIANFTLYKSLTNAERFSVSLSIPFKRNKRD